MFSELYFALTHAAYSYHWRIYIIINWRLVQLTPIAIIPILVFISMSLNFLYRCLHPIPPRLALHRYATYAHLLFPYQSFIIPYILLAFLHALRSIACSIFSCPHPPSLYDLLRRFLLSIVVCFGFGVFRTPFLIRCTQYDIGFTVVININ